MPYEYRFEPGKGLLYATLRGQNSFEISRDAILALSRDPQVRPVMRILVDMRENTYLPTVPEAHQLAKLFRSPGMFHANPVALLIRREGHYGLANLVALFGSIGGVPIRVFTEFHEAEEWLRKLASEE